LTSFSLSGVVVGFDARLGSLVDLVVGVTSGSNHAAGSFSRFCFA
jgi:hypothetical protein